MKKIILVIAITLMLSPVLMGQTKLDIRFDPKSIPQVKLVHNQKNFIPWQLFIKYFDKNMLWEIGPTFKFGPIGLTIRTGVHFKTIDGVLKKEHQEAIVASIQLWNFKFISINELGQFKGSWYFYEHELAYKFIGAHMETLFINTQFEPFLGPIIYPKFKKIPGDIYLTMMWRANGRGEFARVGYKIVFGKN